MWELHYKESWAQKNWCFWTVVLEKTLESPLDSKEIQPVHPKGNQCWIFIGRTDAEAAILWTPYVKNRLIWKDLDSGKDWSWEEMRQTWVRVNSGSWWLTGKPGVLQSMGSQRVGHDWVTELNWNTIYCCSHSYSNPAKLVLFYRHRYWGWQRFCHTAFTAVSTAMANCWGGMTMTFVTLSPLRTYLLAQLHSFPRRSRQGKDL